MVSLIWYQYKLTHYNSANAKLSDSKLDNLISTKDATWVNLRLSFNMTGGYQTNFSHILLLLPDRQISNLHKAFRNHASADIELSIT